MLAERIYNTLRFFDLQNLPLTAYEVNKFLLAEVKSLKAKLNSSYELEELTESQTPVVHFDTILIQLHILSKEGKIGHKNGFYCLPGREEIINERLKSYLHGVKREQLIRRYMGFVRHIPFVRSVSLLGSQALGHQKKTSDIDLFVITDRDYIGMARFLLTAYFQILGVRRHGNKIANRFCLNHYLAGSIALTGDRNLFTAYEYLKYRPLVNNEAYEKFLSENSWAYTFFPNAKQHIITNTTDRKSKIQIFLEKLLMNGAGKWLEQKLISAQLKRIKKGEFTISNEYEMSFHPENRKQDLFHKFFRNGSARSSIE